ncbi:hypothetical protein HZ326_28530 [Fusarium oxysporum f. sp. albedinis]|nr:hypothetical protein HZ326_28530 [Fusarium oxysporum f. sp. albedinis]
MCANFGPIASFTTASPPSMIMGRHKLVGREAFSPHLASSPNLAFYLIRWRVLRSERVTRGVGAKQVTPPSSDVFRTIN